MGHIQLKQVTKRFGDVEVIPSLDLTIQDGEFTVFVGPSGCGKSTLLRLIAGLEDITSGHIEIDGMDATEVAPAKRGLAMVFQSYALYPHMTVRKNIAFPLRMAKMSKAEMKDRVDFCLERVQLEGAGDKYPAEISGGMKKRVGIARAISMNIRYLFCDEPNSGLDPITSRVIDNLLLDITAEYNITTMIISHDMKTAFDIGDKILFLYNGKIRWNGSKDDIHSAGKEIEELGEFINSSQV